MVDVVATAKIDLKKGRKRLMTLAGT